MRIFSVEVFAALIIVISIVGIVVLAGQYFSIPTAYRGAL